MPHANLPDTLFNLTSAPKYLQMLPASSEAKYHALRYCKSILKFFWKFLQLWRCIQHATTIDISDS